MSTIRQLIESKNTPNQVVLSLLKKEAVQMDPGVAQYPITIKFQGDAMRRFTNSDWNAWAGANRMPDGSNPYIVDLELSKTLVRKIHSEGYLDSKIDIDSGLSIILDYRDKGFVLSATVLSVEGYPIIWELEFNEFEQAVSWITKNIVVSSTEGLKKLPMLTWSNVI